MNAVSFALAASLLTLETLAVAQSTGENIRSSAQNVGRSTKEAVADVGDALAKRPTQNPVADNGGIFIEAGSQSLKIGDSHTDIPLYGVGADLNGISWRPSAGFIQLGGNFDVQFARGKLGGYNVTAYTYSAGPTLCYWFVADSGFCLQADVSAMALKQGTTNHLGTIRGGASYRHRLSDQYMAKISYEGGNYSSAGKEVRANNLLLAVSWRPAPTY